MINYMVFITLMCLSVADLFPIEVEQRQACWMAVLLLVKLIIETKACSPQSDSQPFLKDLAITVRILLVCTT